MLKTTASGGVHNIINLVAGAHTLFVADSCGQTEEPFTVVLDAATAPIQADDAGVCAGKTVPLAATAIGVTISFLHIKGCRWISC